jgi:hypothetical protein
MGLLDKLANAMQNFDYEGAADNVRNEVEKKQSSIENRVHKEFKQKARNASDDELRYNLQRAIDNDNYIMEEEIRNEMDRRGLY